MSAKVKSAVSVPVMLTGGVKKVADAEALLQAGKADLIGVGRALLKNALWRTAADR
jgi:2,4-dienoyl-CoA reductase-like NADH-dependent reductase (Old Yellow Enzyme family)